MKDFYAGLFAALAENNITKSRQILTARQLSGLSPFMMMTILFWRVKREYASLHISKEMSSLLPIEFFSRVESMRAPYLLKLFKTIGQQCHEAQIFYQTQVEPVTTEQERACIVAKWMHANPDALSIIREIEWDSQVPPEMALLGLKTLTLRCSEECFLPEELVISPLKYVNIIDPRKIPIFSLEVLNKPNLHVFMPDCVARHYSDADRQQLMPAITRAHQRGPWKKWQKRTRASCDFAGIWKAAFKHIRADCKSIIWALPRACFETIARPLCKLRSMLQEPHYRS